MDLPLYTTATKSELSDLGSANYRLFDCGIVLKQVLRQESLDLKSYSCVSEMVKLLWMTGKF